CNADGAEALPLPPPSKPPPMPSSRFLARSMISRSNCGPATGMRLVFFTVTATRRWPWPRGQDMSTMGNSATGRGSCGGGGSSSGCSSGRRWLRAATSTGRLERHLQGPVAHCVAVERLNGQQGLFVVAHGDKAEAAALAGAGIADHLHRLDRAERTKQLPEDAVLGLRRQVIDEYAPTAAGRHSAVLSHHSLRQQGMVLNASRVRHQVANVVHAAVHVVALVRLDVVAGQSGQLLDRAGDFGGRCSSRAGTVSKLHRDGLAAFFRLETVQPFDGVLCLAALVEPDECDAARQAGLVVVQNAQRDDLAALVEQPLQLVLSHLLGQAADVQVGPLDRFGAGTGERHLDRLILQSQTVQRLDGLVGLLGLHVLDEGVAKALSRGTIAHQLAAFNLADASEEGAHVLLRHGRRQILENDINRRVLQSLLSLSCFSGLLLLYCLYSLSREQFQRYRLGCVLLIRWNCIADLVCLVSRAAFAQAYRFVDPLLVGHKPASWLCKFYHFFEGLTACCQVWLLALLAMERAAISVNPRFGLRWFSRLNLRIGCVLAGLMAVAAYHNYVWMFSIIELVELRAVVNHSADSSKWTLIYVCGVSSGFHDVYQVIMGLEIFCNTFSAGLISACCTAVVAYRLVRGCNGGGTGAGTGALTNRNGNQRLSRLSCSARWLRSADLDEFNLQVKLLQLCLAVFCYPPLMVTGLVRTYSFCTRSELSQALHFYLEMMIQPMKNILSSVAFTAFIVSHRLWLSRRVGKPRRRVCRGGRGPGSRPRPAVYNPEDEALAMEAFNVAEDFANIDDDQSSAAVGSNSLAVTVVIHRVTQISLTVFLLWGGDSWPLGRNTAPLLRRIASQGRKIDLHAGCRDSDAGADSLLVDPSERLLNTPHMGGCCCKEEAGSDSGERDRLLTNPVSDDDDDNVPQPNGGGAGGGPGKSDRPDVQAALSQILENVAVQVIDIGQTGPQVVERQEYTQRARQLLRAGSERLRGHQQPKRRLPVLGVGGNSGGTGAAPSLADTLGRESPPSATDLALAAELARRIAEAALSVSVRVPEDLLAARIRLSGCRSDPASPPRTCSASSTVRACSPSMASRLTFSSSSGCSTTRVLALPPADDAAAAASRRASISARVTFSGTSCLGVALCISWSCRARSSALRSIFSCTCGRASWISLTQRTRFSQRCSSVAGRPTSWLPGSSEPPLYHTASSGPARLSDRQVKGFVAPSKQGPLSQVDLEQTNRTPGGIGQLAQLVGDANSVAGPGRETKNGAGAARRRRGQSELAHGELGVLLHGVQADIAGENVEQGEDQRVGAVTAELAALPQVLLFDTADQSAVLGDPSRVPAELLLLLTDRPSGQGHQAGGVVGQTALNLYEGGDVVDRCGGRGHRSGLASSRCWSLKRQMRRLFGIWRLQNTGIGTGIGTNTGTGTGSGGSGAGAGKYSGSGQGSRPFEPSPYSAASGLTAAWTPASESVGAACNRRLTGEGWHCRRYRLNNGVLLNGQLADHLNWHRRERRRSAAGARALTGSLIRRWSRLLLAGCRGLRLAAATSYAVHAGQHGLLGDNSSVASSRCRRSRLLLLTLALRGEHNSNTVLLLGSPSLVPGSCGLIIIVDILGHLPHLQDVVLGHGADHPRIIGIPGEIRDFGRVAAVNEQQLRRPVLGVFGRLLLADLAQVPHVQAAVRTRARQDGLVVRRPLDLRLLIVANAAENPIVQQVPGHVLYNARMAAEPVALLLVAFQSNLWATLAARIGLRRMLSIVKYEHIRARRLRGNNSRILRHEPGPVHLALVVNLNLDVDFPRHRAESAVFAFVGVVVAGVELGGVVGQLDAGNQQSLPSGLVTSGSHWAVRLGHSNACVITRSYKNGVFFFQILYSSLMIRSSTVSSAASQRQHSGLNADRLALGPVEVVCTPGQLVEIHIRPDVHLARMNLHNTGSGLLVWGGEFDFAIEPTRTEQGGIEDVDAISGGNHFDLHIRLEAVQLVEQLQHGALYLAIAGLLRVESSSMKMMAGAFSLAREKASRTSLEPSPMNICTSWGPASFRNVLLVCAAQARASRVLPGGGGVRILTDNGQEISLPSASFNHGRFALALRVQVNIGAVGLFGSVNVQQFNYVGH
uniref:Ragulator complex protein LAMTOR1 n=1 Tax=Macrostomum lignano TaxID=282301 RepID=A0A1I8GPN7_9PLAT